MRSRSTPPILSLHVRGDRLYAQSVVHFASHDEPTSFVSDTKSHTGLKPSLWQEAVVVGSLGQERHCRRAKRQSLSSSSRARGPQVQAHHTEESQEAEMSEYLLLDRYPLIYCTLCSKL